MTHSRVFRFQQFSVSDAQSAMKVGTDSILLGAWACVGEARQILDIGTGCGLLALMLGQRSLNNKPAIEAIDVDRGSVEQAAENFAASPWSERLTAIHQSVHGFSKDARQTKRYDLIISNPPFFEGTCSHRTNSIKDQISPSAELNSRGLARRTIGLPRETFFQCCDALMSETGRLAIVLPYDQRERTHEIAAKFSMIAVRETSVRPLPELPYKRVLFEFSRLSGNSPDDIQLDELTLETTHHDYTHEFRQLTKDFYLRWAKGGKQEPGNPATEDNHQINERTKKGRR